MNKEEFRKYAIRAADLILKNYDSKRDFSVVSDNYFVEGRIKIKDVFNTLEVLPEKEGMKLARKVVSGAYFDLPTFVSMTPALDTENDIENMVSYWIKTGLERILIFNGEKTRKAVDKLLADKILAPARNKHIHYGQWTSENRRLHVYEVPESILSEAASEKLIVMN
ncbi:MAG: hypothetical protein NT120_04860 [Candidatus Aenigmarchaeota archaeon]|nr:hypothetical protein [Candidatus Aenigmarchaeota archaeon]